MATATEVTAGKPKIGGHVYRAPYGTALPTDAKTALSSAYIDMGYISEDGVTNANTPESEIIKAWGGIPVLTVQTSKEDKYKLKFISAMNVEVQKMVYSSDNVTGTSVSASGGLTVKANSKELEDYTYVIEMLARGNVAHRVVIPCAKPTEIGDIVYKDNDTVGYDVTLGCTGVGEEGNTHFEYWEAN